MLSDYLKEFSAAKGRVRVDFISKLYVSCFETPEDRTAFELKHGAPNLHSTALWTYTRMTPDSIVPTAIFLEEGEEAMSLIWFNNEKQYHRPTECGPASVKINLLTGKCIGTHWVDGQSVPPPTKSWKKCARSYNHWLRLLEN